MARILVIDDDAAVREAIGQTLKLAGHLSLLAAGGQQGVILCRSLLPDMAIVDIFMPEQDGFETIAALRWEFQELPIIAMSGGHLTSDSMLTVAQRLGAVRILEKPFEATTLLNMVEELLQLQCC